MSVRIFKPEKTLRPKGFASGFSWPKDLPVDIEVGCGVGLHPIRYSAEHSDRHLIAIEHTKDKFESFHRRYLNHDSPSNLTPVHADAVAWLSHFAPLESIDRCFFLYPNPYPKGRQKNLRWAQRPFMSYLITLLRPKGQIIFASNLKDYVQETRDILCEHHQMHEVDFSVIEATAKPRTHFEKKYLLRGEQCFNLILEKPDTDQRS